MLSSTSVTTSVSVSLAAEAVDETAGVPTSPGAVDWHGGVSIWPGAGGAHGGVSICPANAGKPIRSVSMAALVSLRSLFMFFSLASGLVFELKERMIQQKLKVRVSGGLSLSVP